MTDITVLIERVQQTQHGFTDIKATADELIADCTRLEVLTAADALFQSEIPQARMLAVFLWGHFAAEHSDPLAILHDKVSRDPDWRVQEILAQAFDQYCKQISYEKALTEIESWLRDPHPNVRRAASEGLRIWTARPYFKQHPDVAVRLLSALHADDSEYVRKSVGNALRDISRKHPDLIRIEVATWDLGNPQTAYTHKLASKFLADD
jgi:3-methyladenine DNA glycosylase AlkD